MRLYRLKPHILRYWEQEFRDIRPVKSSKGQRLYRKRDLEAIFTSKSSFTKKGLLLTAQKDICTHRRLSWMKSKRI